LKYNPRFLLAPDASHRDVLTLVTVKGNPQEINMTDKPRLAVIHYLNTLPLVWGMLHGREREAFDLSFSTPAACAEALKRGEVDIGIIPVIEYQRIPDLMVVPEIAIVSRQRVRS
jgi:hypothetical protein